MHISGGGKLEDGFTYDLETGEIVDHELDTNSPRHVAKAHWSKRGEVFIQMGFAQTPGAAAALA